MNKREQWIIDSQRVEVDSKARQPISEIRKQLNALCDRIEGGEYDKFEMSFTALNESQRRIVVGGVAAYSQTDGEITADHIVADVVIHESESLNTCDVYDAFIEDIELHLSIEEGQQHTYTSVCIGQHSDGDTTCFKYRKENE